MYGVEAKHSIKQQTVVKVEREFVKATNDIIWHYFGQKEKLGKEILHEDYLSTMDCILKIQKYTT